MQIHPDWLVPDWPAPTRIKAVFTTRAGITGYYKDSPPVPTPLSALPPGELEHELCCCC